MGSSFSEFDREVNDDPSSAGSSGGSSGISQQAKNTITTVVSNMIKGTGLRGKGGEVVKTPTFARIQDNMRAMFKAKRGSQYKVTSGEIASTMNKYRGGGKIISAPQVRTWLSSDQRSIPAKHAGRFLRAFADIAGKKGLL